MRTKKAVITAAGLGIRMYPATKAMKKELFPLVDRQNKARPALWYVFQDALNGFIDEICLVIRKEDEPLFRKAFSGELPKELQPKMDDFLFKQETWFLEELSHKITYVYQDKPDGFGHAVHCAKDWVGKDPFVLLLGDQVYLSNIDIREKKIFSCTDQLLEIFREKERTIIGVHRTPENLVSRYGTIAGLPAWKKDRLYEVTEFVEKPDIDFAKKKLRIEGIPDNHYLCFFGIYAFTPDIMNALEFHIKNNIRERGEIQLTSAMEMLRRKSDKVYAYEINGDFYDIGNPQGYVQAINAFSQRSNY